jgi:trehalose synthase
MLTEVSLGPSDPTRFRELLDETQWAAFSRSLDDARRFLADRRLWFVNSTAHGGGVAEMLQSLVRYLIGAGIDARWLVVDGSPEFFDVTKRIHNMLHGGAPGDGQSLEPEDLWSYTNDVERAVVELAGCARPGDVALLEDPQTANLAPALRAMDVGVVWRCHVGIDAANQTARDAWDFLLPFVRAASDVVFTRHAYVWEGLPEECVSVIAPCIDAFSPKNQELDEGAIRSILSATGIQPDARANPAAATFQRLDGTQGRAKHQARLIETHPLPADAPVVLQVSRWDRLKDPVGVLEGFARHVPHRLGAHLVLGGPATGDVTDDPEEGEVFGEVSAAWESLAEPDRQRVHLVCTPPHDQDENSAIVNALQRRADVVVQKSLAEGFGLTVAEAMWKAAPTVGSRVGGIQDQIEHGRSGLLVDDPGDLAAFGATVTRALTDRDEAARLGAAARERVRREFLAPVRLTRELRLVQRVLPAVAP